MFALGGVALLGGWAGVLAWIANTAASRGRSQIGWVILGVIITAVWSALALMLPLPFDGSGDVGLFVVAKLGVTIVIYGSLGGLGLWLRASPVRVRSVRIWPVASPIHGSGRLEITADTVRLAWQDRVQEIARAELTSAAQDGESLRLTWRAGELVVIPMGKPETRDGRIAQSRTLAQKLAPSLPAAIQVRRNAPSAARPGDR